MSSRNGIFNKFQELTLDKVSAFPVLDYPDAENGRSSERRFALGDAVLC